MSLAEPDPAHPFPDHYSLLQQLHRHLAPRTYLEIGVRNGKSLCLAARGTTSIGIDPEMAVRHRLRRRTYLFGTTSDDFFARYDVPALTRGLPIDLGLIDGLHVFEQALLDFANLESCSNPAGMIVIDDTLPTSEAVLAGDQVSGSWSGDVWKVVACLLDHRTDLRVMSVGVPEAGMTFVTNLDPSSTVLCDRYQDLCDTYRPLQWDSFVDFREHRFSLVPNSWDHVRRIVPAPFRTADADGWPGPVAAMRPPSRLRTRLRLIRYSRNASRQRAWARRP